MTDRERWEKLRADYLTASRAARDLDIQLSVKYGPGFQLGWASKAEQKKLTQLRQRLDRIGDKMFAILERVSPRDWGRGVPTHWLREELSWEDAVRPIGEPLSVTPPLSYGSTTPMRDNPASTVYHESGSYRDGTLHVYKKIYGSLSAAKKGAREHSTTVDGYVTVMQKGIEVAQFLWGKEVPYRRSNPQPWSKVFG